MKFLFYFFMSFLLSAVLVPLVIKFCYRKGFLDLPSERKIHSRAIPRLGGLAIFVSFVATVVYALIS
ncbi:MAG TPA: undecaprenyl/decaprenyl-phosphate alpha-N-acetylglucosaminyl 1-phosphate transferase, partial [Candidatus Omnitrophota bacterium]|nr:undecaprenyl/decaprenyl-phosphate alpha-N-acetylglucosaminyl 1-phosphate transferase [Candidatus Omnitrophota bacterium]